MKNLISKVRSGAGFVSLFIGMFGTAGAIENGTGLKESLILMIIGMALIAWEVLSENKVKVNDYTCNRHDTRLKFLP